MIEPPKKNSVPPGTMAGRNGGKLRIGNPGNRGGGRPSDALRIRAETEIERGQILERLAKIGSGDILDPDRPGAKPPSIRDQIRAISALLRIACGAPRQSPRKQPSV